MSYGGYPMGGQPFPGSGGQAPGGYGGAPSFQNQAAAMGYMSPTQQQAPAPSQHYGSYGQTTQQNIYSINAAQSMQFSSQDELIGIFESKKSQRFNAIQAQELCSILNETQQIRNYYKISWSMELCKIMIAMLDRSKDGMMQLAEFQELLQCLVYWYQTFCQYDTNRSGYMESHELGNCVKHKYGYTLSAKAMEALLKRYSRAMDDGRLLIAFDDFVSLSVRLRAYTEAFRARDRVSHAQHETGTTEFQYDDFLQCVMCL